MDSVKWSAYGVLGLAALALAVFLFDGLFPPFLGIAVSLAVSGILLLALERGLRLLADIRDAALRQNPMPLGSDAAQNADETAVGTTAKTLAELGNDLDRIKAKLG